jgi:tetratricopeptide (TPR) repeat protein
MMLYSGLEREVLPFLVRESRLDPLDPIVWSNRAFAHGLLGDFEDAAMAAEQVELLTAADAYNWVHAPMYYVYARSGRIDRVLAHIERLRELEEGPDKLNYLLHRRYAEVEVARARGDEAGIRDFIDHTVGFGMIEHAIVLHLELGDVAEAEALYREVRRRPFDRIFGTILTRMHIGPDQRRHPLVREMFGRLGLNSAWRLELCLRAASLDPATGLGCSVARYERET